MSTDFWLDLALALGAFSLVVLALPQVRASVIRRFNARSLRPKLGLALQRLIALIAQSVDPNEFSLEYRSNALHKVLAELQGYQPMEKTLFSDEQKSLKSFREKLIRMLPYIESGGPRTRELEDLILFGQRIVSDLGENSK